MEIFARRLRELRENKRLVQKDMAVRLGISDVAYGGWERNQAEPSITNLVKLCQFFGVSADYLVGMDRIQDQGKAPILEKIRAVKTEADQAAATLTRLLGEIKTLEKEV